MTKRQIAKIIISVLIAALTALGAGFGLRHPHRHHPKRGMATR